jgi:pyruvate/2-oxoglutarate dehydrogenase complex dihydrolipoamide dehydrogenase (E3) component
VTPTLAPRDAHDRELVANVHPPDWTNPAPARRYNLVVLGAGTAGLVTAAGAAGLGARVALVERHLMGGDCLNVGCVPSKAVLRAARGRADVRRAPELGVRIAGDGVAVDFAAVMERMRRLRAALSPTDSAARFRALGVDVFLGEGRFIGGDGVQVGGTVLRFARAVVATGARPAVPAIPGLAEAPYLTNETVFALTTLPARLAVIGAGPIGCELGQAFARFGAQVTLLDSAPRILPRDDPDAAALVTAALRADGVRLALGSTIRRVEVVGAETRVHAEMDGVAETIAADALLVAAGRAPNVEALGLEDAGVRFDARRGVHVDDALRTSNRRIFAAGDVCASERFTHVADAHARIVLRNALFLGRARASALTVPWCTYTDPEVAHVGLTERAAAARGIPIRTFVQPLGEVDRAVLDGETEGFAKVHVRAGTDRIVGGTIVARHAGEMISELTLAMVTGTRLRALADVIHPYPTQADALRRLGDAANRARLTPAVKRWLEAWLAWRR